MNATQSSNEFISIKNHIHQNATIDISPNNRAEPKLEVVNLLNYVVLEKEREVID